MFLVTVVAVAAQREGRDGGGWGVMCSADDVSKPSLPSSLSFSAGPATFSPPRSFPPPHSRPNTERVPFKDVSWQLGRKMIQEEEGNVMALPVDQCIKDTL